MNLVFFLSYRGSRYNGWQKQKLKQKSKQKSVSSSKSIQTVQGIIEKTLVSFFAQEINIVASGRTDKGVHADEQVFSFNLKVAYKDHINLHSLKKRFNNFLPEDIKITRILKGEENFNPRYQAKVRCYRYSLLNFNAYSKQAQEIGQHYILPFEVDLEKLHRYFVKLEGEHDFSTFCSKKPDLPNKVRKIFKIDIIPREPFVYIDIYGNAFLKSMVRSIIGNVLQAYQKGLPYETITEWLEKKDPNCAKKRVPPQGLTLRKVFYLPIFE